jgi:predicted oxidoreductase
MKTQNIGAAALEASRIAYGCMQIGGGWDAAPPTSQQRENGLKAVWAALDEGINFFDHADIYCRGKSEEVFAGIWKERPGLRDKILVQTKCGIRFGGDPHPSSPARYDFSYAHITASVDAALQRLQTDYLDILLLHRPDALVEPEEVAQAFSELHQSGKVRFFGVSNHTAAQIELLARFLDQPLVANQLELSLLHTHLLDEGIVSNQDNPPHPVRNHGTLEYCRLHNITIQAWGPLAYGRLSGRKLENPNDTEQKAAALVEEMAQAKSVSREAILVAWLLRHPARIQPVIGTTQPARIRAACQADRVELTREEWYALFTAGRGGALP